MLATVILGSGKEHNTQNNTQQNINDKNKGKKEKMRKEIFKKYSSAALALGLAATAVLPTTSLLAGKAAAEGETTKTPKIIIDNFVAGETYNAYKIFDLTHSGSAVAYTIDSDWTTFFGSGGTGASYIVDNNIFSCSDTSYTEEGACKDAGKTWSGLNQIIVGGAIKYMNITEANKANFAQDALEYTSGLDADGSITPAEDATSAEISGEKITLGYYLVYNGGIKKGEWTTLAALDSAMPEATVEPKAIFPEINKTDKDTYVEVGQVAEFTINNIVVPDTTGYSSYEYVVTDTMTNGLTFTDADLTNLTVKFGDTAISTGDNFTKAKNGNGFILTFKKGIFAGHKGETIVITYNATVNRNAVVDVTSRNTVELKYNVDPRDLTKTETDTAFVNLYSSKIDIHKHDTACDYDATDCKLANAKFVLKKVVTEDEKSVTYYYQAFNGETRLNNVSSTNTVTRVAWTTVKDDATVLVTDNSGLATFEGLEDGTYYIEETAAPDGYNRLTQDITVVIAAGEDGKLIAEVADIPNVTGTELPTTGALGTKIFITLGAITALGAAVVLVANKRMANEEA